MPATKYAVTAGSFANLARRDKSKPANKEMDKESKICIKKIASVRTQPLRVRLVR
jgi:hypothetical protein